MPQHAEWTRLPSNVDLCDDVEKKEKQRIMKGNSDASLSKGGGSNRKGQVEVRARVQIEEVQRS